MFKFRNLLSDKNLSQFFLVVFVFFGNAIEILLNLKYFNENFAFEGL